jgi:hypothetical protein
MHVFELDVELIVPQHLKDKLQMIHMIFQGSTKYQCVIHEDQNELPHKWSKN